MGKHTIDLLLSLVWMPVTRVFYWWGRVCVLCSGIFPHSLDFPHIARQGRWRFTSKRSLSKKNRRSGASPPGIFISRTMAYTHIRSIQGVGRPIHITILADRQVRLTRDVSFREYSIGYFDSIWRMYACTAYMGYVFCVSGLKLDTANPFRFILRIVKVFPSPSLLDRDISQRGLIDYALSDYNGTQLLSETRRTWIGKVKF